MTPTGIPEYEKSFIAALLDDPESLGGRLLVFGDADSGRSTLTAQLAGAQLRKGRTVIGIDADIGSPSFGVPGAVCRGRWQNGGWRVTAMAAVCSLDAGRFRLPVVTAVALLTREVSGGPLLLEAPGMVRGSVGAELLQGLITAADIDTVLVLAPERRRPPVARILAAAGTRVHWIDTTAATVNKERRARRRTELWDRYLDGGSDHRLSVSHLPLSGVRPEHAQSWRGRQVALLTGGRTTTMGEALDLEGDRLMLRLPAGADCPPAADGLLVRDAGRTADNRLATVQGPVAGRSMTPAAPGLTVAAALPAASTADSAVTLKAENADICLVNGVFGDPLLVVQLRRWKRLILFDMGEGQRLPARLAHRVTDVFISHAHMDHIAGFLWLLRSRIGNLPPCRLYGPPGLAERIGALMDGIHWDRIGPLGPAFEVTEFNGRTRQCRRLQAGNSGRTSLPSSRLPPGVLLADPALTVRATVLDHGIPVLAFCLSLPPHYNIRQDRLLARGWPPGPWLGELKRLAAAGRRDRRLTLPDGSRRHAGELIDDLVTTRAGHRLAYATDLADTPVNRQALRSLAEGVDTLFCEAGFLMADRLHADRNGHLTARACGEVAAAARVRSLVPFHLSKRYESDPDPVFREAAQACPGTAVVWPPAIDPPPG